MRTFHPFRAAYGVSKYLQLNTRKLLEINCNASAHQDYWVRTFKYLHPFLNETDTHFLVFTASVGFGRSSSVFAPGSLQAHRWLLLSWLCSLQVHLWDFSWGWFQNLCSVPSPVLLFLPGEMLPMLQSQALMPPSLCVVCSWIPTFG